MSSPHSFVTALLPASMDPSSKHGLRQLHDLHPPRGSSQEQVEVARIAFLRPALWEASLTCGPSSVMPQPIAHCHIFSMEHKYIFILSGMLALNMITLTLVQ